MTKRASIPPSGPAACVLCLLPILFAWAGQPRAETPKAPFRAGAAAVDVTPEQFPVIVNGGFLSKTSTNVFDRLHARWLVLDDGATRVAIGVLDTCLIPVEFADQVKARAKEATGLPPDRISISATHTHSAPSLMRCLGTDADPNYPAFALPRIVEGLRQAVENLAPAQVGWTSTSAPDHTHTRVWIRRPDRMLPDPFGEITVRANMHPGFQNPDAIAPSGPSDPEITLLAVRHADGRPMAVLANYAMHYFGAAPVSADYYGLFAEKLARLVGGGQAPPGFVAIMSQGFSGDQHWMDYSQPKPAGKRGDAIDTYAGEVARIAFDACRDIKFRDAAPIRAAASELRLATRQPDDRRLQWAKDLMARMGDSAPKNQPEVYAREQLWLKDNPVRTVKLQAMQVGDFGITFTPCEVFAISSLKIKARSPMPLTMNIELANGEEGYIPPAELHPLGGYNTWSCRSAGLEVNAESRIVDALLRLLEQLSGRPRRAISAINGPYARAVIEAKPLAYWRLEELDGPSAADATGAARGASFEKGVVLGLDGPPSPAFSGEGAANRAAHFAGGRLLARIEGLDPASTVEFWFWNGLPNDARAVTGILFGRGEGEFLAMEGTAGAPGRLAFHPAPGPPLTGRSTILPRTWHHLAVVRDGPRVRVHLDGQAEPEISGETPGAASAPSPEIFIGGRASKGLCPVAKGLRPSAMEAEAGSGFATKTDSTFEGKIDEIAVFDRPLSQKEIQRHFELAAPASPATAMIGKQGAQP